MNKKDDDATAGLKNLRWQGLGVRALSAAVLVPAVLIDVWQGGVWFSIFAALLGVLIAHEWTITAHGRSSTQFALHAAAALAAVFLPFDAGLLPAVSVIFALLALSIFAAMLRDREKSFWTYFGVLYVALPVLALVLLRHDPKWGTHAIIWLLLVVWATDTCAYFAGRIIGGPKLVPRLSPQKTWAGLLGGAAGAALFSALYAAHFLQDWLALAFVAAAVAVISQAGDIFESAFKRHYGIKDSGTLIPGHGGVMDRVDGLVAAALAAALIGYVRNPSGLAEGLLLW